MAHIVFKGLTKADDPILEEILPTPKGARTLRLPANPMAVSMLYGIPMMLLCFAALLIKRNMMNDFPMVRSLLPLGLLLGLACCFVHEWLHALPQPKGATAYIGLIPRHFMFYMKCKEPLSRGRFILMSLLPVVLGVLPLAGFMLSGSQELNAILWPMAMIGLVSPSPDYQHVAQVLRQVPKGARIQDSEDGMCWYLAD